MFRHGLINSESGGPEGIDCVTDYKSSNTDPCQGYPTIAYEAVNGWSTLDQVAIAYHEMYIVFIRAELYALLIALTTTKNHPLHTFKFTDSLNSLYLINNDIQHPSSQ